MSNKPKTLREWADHLPEPIRTEFLANCQEEESDPNYLDSIPRHANMPGVIISALTWEKTRQGRDYWLAIHTRACNGEFDKPQIQKENEH